MRPLTPDNEDLAAQIVSEQSQTWTGTIGLISASDYIRANNDMTTCGTLSDGRLNYETCRGLNWMYNNKSYWTIFPDPSVFCSVFYVGVDVLRSFDADNSVVPRPATYLKSDITLTGTGLQSDPFKLA